MIAVCMFVNSYTFTTVFLKYEATEYSTSLVPGQPKSTRPNIASKLTDCSTSTAEELHYTVKRVS